MFCNKTLQSPYLCTVSGSIFVAEFAVLLLLHHSLKEFSVCNGDFHSSWFGRGAVKERERERERVSGTSRAEQTPNTYLIYSCYSLTGVNKFLKRRPGFEILVMLPYLIRTF
jgi:hypothetical protein